MRSGNLKFSALILYLFALFGGIHSAPGQTALGIMTTNNLSTLYWSLPSNANGVLQSSPSLISPNWTDATDAVPYNYVSGAAVQVTDGAQARFFRLWLVRPSAEGMAYIPAGSFTIGDTLDGLANATPTNVYVSAFFMDRNLVTSNLWSTVYNFATNSGYSFTNAGAGKADTHPVQMVDWYDCVKWCNARSQWMGRQPVYFTDPALTQIFTNGETNVTVYVNWTNNGFRLPTEAEWEKAARGGLSEQRFPWGDTISWSQANYSGDSLAVNINGFAYDLSTSYGVDPAFIYGPNTFTSPVESFPANGYGLFDMAGNVTEFCWDWFNTPPYPTGSPYLGGSDPRGPATGTYRVIRGGDWEGYANAARSAFRTALFPTDNDNYSGFRCVRAPVFFVE
jgi:formylglycine-generating enzyme required for sulfatase activity